MGTSTLGDKGQITIPAEVRERLGLQAGDRIEFVETDGMFAMRPAIDDVRSLKGLLRKPMRAIGVGAMKAATRTRGAAR
jgi:antitoxin PrlF